MKVHALSFGNINIDGQDYVKDIVINGGKIEKRKKKNQKNSEASLVIPLYISA